MINYEKYHIDYFTSTRDFDEALKMKIWKDVNEYHWKKLREFRKGNIFLVRDYKKGLDYLLQLVEDPMEMNEFEREKAGVYGSQNWVGKYVIIAKDDEPSIYKKRYISEATKEKIKKKYNYNCQGIFKVEHLGEILRCPRNFKDGEFEVEFHHVIEFSRAGGLTIEDNLIPLCKECHAMKTALFKRDLINRLEQVKNSPNIIK